MRSLLLFGAALHVVAAVGCVGKHPTTDLEGMVTVDGQAAAKGGLTFTPLAANQGKGVFAPIANGRYQAKGVALGKTRVSFLLTKETGRMQNVYGRDVPELVNVLPPKYDAGMGIEIEPGQMSRDFELRSQ